MPSSRKPPELTLEMIQASFHVSMVAAANTFNTCTTRLKKVCRQHGIQRWPHRQVRTCSPDIEPCYPPDSKVCLLYRFRVL
jgi:hypothetical protein